MGSSNSEGRQRRTRDIRKSSLVNLRQGDAPARVEECDNTVFLGLTFRVTCHSAGGMGWEGKYQQCRSHVSTSRFIQSQLPRLASARSQENFGVLCDKNCERDHGGVVEAW